MEQIFILQHSYQLESGCDETKFIGAYSSEDEAKSAIERLKLQPGFRDRPNDFYIEQYALNKDHWTEGYSTMTNIFVKCNTGEWVAVSAEILSDRTYRIWETNDRNFLHGFKYKDLVKCEEKNGELFAIESMLPLK